MARRLLLNHFNLNNPVYGAASISVWLANASRPGVPTDVLATLFSDPWSQTALGNPIKLTGRGRWPQPVYVEAPVFLVCSPAKRETGAGVLQTFLNNVPPPAEGWGASPT
jgi:hypothetical protein